MTVEQQPDLIGGFVLRVGDREFDWSLRGRVRQLQQRLIRR
jgi:F-type H+-transporting ATPase subunit delta